MKRKISVAIHRQGRSRRRRQTAEGQAVPPREKGRGAPHDNRVRLRPVGFALACCSALAAGTVLQVDQAASPHQDLLRVLRKRGQDADLDRGVGLRTDRHHAQAPRDQQRPLQNVTDSVRDALRKNRAETST